MGKARRKIWEAAFMSVLAAGGDVTVAGEIADAALIEWEKRWVSDQRPGIAHSRG